MFKRMLILFLTLIIGLGTAVTLSSCSKPVENIEPSPVESENNESKIELKGEYLDNYKEVNAPEVSKFLGTMIVNIRPEDYRISDIPIISTTDKDADMIFTLMHLNAGYLEEYAVSTSQSNTRAYSVAIVKAKKGYEEEVVVGLSTRIDDLRRGVKNYPDQLYLVDNVVMEQVGDYLVFIICDNADKVYDEFYKVMVSTDLNDLTVVSMMTEAERLEIENKYLEQEKQNINSEIGEVIVTPISEEPIEDLNVKNEE